MNIAAKKIIVIAGTPVDTRMGADAIAISGTGQEWQPLEFPISATPQEQNELQYLDPERLHELYEAKVREGIEAGGQAVFLYCNSLSTAINYHAVAERLGVPTISPLDVYADWASRYSRLGLIAANSQAATGIEAHMRAVNPHVEIISLGLLPVVQAIEEQLPPREIIKDFGLAELLSWFGALRFDHAVTAAQPVTEMASASREILVNRSVKEAVTGAVTALEQQTLEGAMPTSEILQGVILGCTHFPYLKAELATISNLPLLDPAQEMLSRLSAAL